MVVAIFSSTFPWSRFFFLVSEHFSHLDADPHEVALWVLLKKTKSTDKAVRLQAVQELAEKHHWHGKRLDCWKQLSFLFFNLPCCYISSTVWMTDYQYQTAAQVIDQRTAVGLARTHQADLRFFLRKPSLPDLEDVNLYCTARIISWWAGNLTYTFHKRVCLRRMNCGSCWPLFLSPKWTSVFSISLRWPSGRACNPWQHSG